MTKRASPPQRGRERLGRLVRWAVTVACVAALVTHVNFSDVARHLVRVDPLGVLLALLTLVIARLLKAAKSFPLVRVHADLPFGFCFRAYLASAAVAYLFPASIGGDVVRAVALGRRQDLLPEVSASIAMERILGIVTLVCANLLATLYTLQGTQNPTRIAVGAVGLAILAIAVMVLPLNGRIRHWTRQRTARLARFRWLRPLARFGRAYGAYRHQPGVLTLVFVATLLETVLIVIALAFLAEAAHTRITFPMLLVVTPLALVLYRLPVTYWGLGVADGAFAFLLNVLYFIPPTQAITVVAAFRIVELCAVIPGVALWRDLARGAGSLSAARTEPAA